ncbi:hypothetical protein CAPTEDRAFT_209069 [Capitella teleta]|uniref:Uncharacterized protein n=1 Tax=Capitella teleta TaxID=283909 RepID=R7TYL7_CAPTE|nr:hypothetical protein CAPTEDRAFT_209069 [Capitella teleta]|eukprot:ELT96065.1 hypothetical protein CAPTEDRAFT_209069 [Capitella teleta]
MKDHKFRYNLRNTTYFINEDLTRVRSTLLYKSRLMKRQGHFKDCWTHDGSIVYKDNTAEAKIRCYVDNKVFKIELHSRNPPHGIFGLDIMYAYLRNIDIRQKFQDLAFI